MMGASAESAGDNAAAIRHYQESVPLCPGLYNAAARLADLYLRTGKHEAAVKAATAIIELDRADGWARTVRGKAYRALGRNAEALADFESATELGYRPAFEELAWFYETGTGVPKDVRRALELYTIAAYDESPTASASAARLRASVSAPR
jgi:TPR repeat protein